MDSRPKISVNHRHDRPTKYDECMADELNDYSVIPVSARGVSWYHYYIIPMSLCFDEAPNRQQTRYCYNLLDIMHTCTDTWVLDDTDETTRLSVEKNATFHLTIIISVSSITHLYWTFVVVAPANFRANHIESDNAISASSSSSTISPIPRPRGKEKT